MVFINIIIGLFLIAMGFTIHLGKRYDLIAGYNSMDDKEKESFDIDKFAKHFGITFYIMGLGVVISALVFELLNINGSYWIAVLSVLVLGGALYLVILGEIMKRSSKI